MSKLLDFLHDDELDFTVSITDSGGHRQSYEFLDIVLYEQQEYAVVSPLDDSGDVEIFRILTQGTKESYERITDDDTLIAVFDIFKVKNEDEFDFD